MYKIAFYSIVFLLISCNYNKQEKHFNEENLIKAEDVGEYHSLLNDAIKIFLPVGFRELSESEIQIFIDSIKVEEHRDYFKKSYEMRKFISNNYYNFYNQEYESEIQVTTIPYTPFDRSSASQLLYLLRKEYEKYEEITGISHSKITAKYLGTHSLQVFKAIYLLSNNSDNKNSELQLFKTVYIISSNNKSFILNVMTPFEFDFDPFVRKTKFQ